MKRRRRSAYVRRSSRNGAPTAVVKSLSHRLLPLAIAPVTVNLDMEITDSLLQKPYKSLPSILINHRMQPSNASHTRSDVVLPTTTTLLDEQHDDYSVKDTALKHCSSASSLSSSPTKILLAPNGAATVAISHRHHLYEILQRLATLVDIQDDDLVILKKSIDAEVGDVIQALLALESVSSPQVIISELQVLLRTGSPAKHVRVEQKTPLPSLLPALRGSFDPESVPYPLQKLARNLQPLFQAIHNASSAHDAPTLSNRAEVIVLVSTGAYNPVHLLHLRAFYVARQYIESNNSRIPVVGAFISPSHDTMVRVKTKNIAKEMIPGRHRLALVEEAVRNSSWIEADKWEITRRRVQDYLSLLAHVRDMCEGHFSPIKFRLIYVCGCNTVVKLSLSAMKEEGFGCITVCRPTQTNQVMRHLGKNGSKYVTVVEDTGVLPQELEQTTSNRVRKELKQLSSKGNEMNPKLEKMLGRPACQYLVRHEIGKKISGKETWSEKDRQWRVEDLSHVEYAEN